MEEGDMHSYSIRVYMMSDGGDNLSVTQSDEIKKKLETITKQKKLQTAVFFYGIGHEPAEVKNVAHTLGCFLPLLTSRNDI